MKKNKIMWIIILAIILIGYMGYVVTDSIRLRNSKLGTKPIITISEESTEDKLTYIGIGYSITYYKNIDKIEENAMTLIEQLGYGAEFRLFNRILIWAWVE